MSELSTISRHAITVLAGQLAVMAFGVTDTIVAGRHGEASLAALSAGRAHSVVGMAILLSPAPLLRWTEVPPALRTEVESYLAVLALALPPALLFRIYSTLNQALGRPKLVTWLQVG